MPGANRNNIKWGIVVEGIGPLQRACKLLGETDAPFLREAMYDSQELVADAVQARAPGGIKKGVLVRAVRGKGASLVAPIAIKHPGARSMEFGRVWYYKATDNRRGSIGNNRGGIGPGGGSKRRKGSIKAGSTKVRRKGQRARPFIGIVNNDAAIAATSDRVREVISAAIVKEWDRILAEGD